MYKVDDIAIFLHTRNGILMKVSYCNNSRCVESLGWYIGIVWNKYDILF